MLIYTNDILKISSDTIFGQGDILFFQINERKAFNKLVALKDLWKLKLMHASVILRRYVIWESAQAHQLWCVIAINITNTFFLFFPHAFMLDWFFSIS
jgi:hypothetical protein